MTTQPRACLAAVDTVTGSVQNWSPSVAGAVYQLAVAGGTVYAGGSFQIVNDSTTGWDNVAAFSAADGTTTSFSPMVGGDVFALGVAGSKVMAGGAFRTAGPGDTEPVRRDNLAALDLPTGNVKAWSPTTDGTVFALGVSSSTVYAGGAFTQAGNGTSPAVARRGLASFDAASGATTNWSPTVNGVVFALELLGSNVYVGGNFTSANGGGVVRNRLAAFSGHQPGHGAAELEPECQRDRLRARRRQQRDLRRRRLHVGQRQRPRAPRLDSTRTGR